MLLYDPALKHLPGRHDQSSHGRGGGVRSVLAKAASLADIEQAFSAEARRITGRDVRANLKGSDPQMAREHGEGVLQGLERYPNSRLGRIETYGPGGATERHPGDPKGGGGTFAITTNGRWSEAEDVIAFNVYYAGNPARYKTVLRMNERAGWSATGTPTGVALHEYGHVVAGHDYTYYLAEQKAKEAAKAAHRRTSNYVKENVSMYAADSDAELTAEALADVMVNGDGASDLSKSIVAVLDQRFAPTGDRS